jgi:hypothetical protein
MQCAAGSLALASGRSFGIVRHHIDDALLEDLSRRSSEYFADAVDPETGISTDLIHGNPEDNLNKGDEARGSTGVTGVALTATCIGAERGWIPRHKASHYVRQALRSFTNDKLFQQHTWSCHFIDIHTGERWKDVEMSTSDSIRLLAGALPCRQSFLEDHEIEDLSALL